VRGVGLISTFSLQIVLARELGARAFGLYSFGFALLLLFLIPAKFGLDQSAFRFASERLGRSDPDGAHRYIRTAIVHALGVSTAVALLWCAVALTGGLGALGNGSVDVVLIAACLPCLAIIRVTEGSLRATGHSVAAYTPFALCWPLAFLATVIGFGGVMPMDLHSVLVVQLVVFAGVAGWQTRAAYGVLDGSQIRASAAASVVPG
jgi:O-antigen/teichoic acid export membrane protein